MKAVEPDEEVIDGGPGDQGSFLTMPPANSTAGKSLQVQRAERASCAASVPVTASSSPASARP